ncbi:MAG TPA: response regulator [Acidobacteriaceae bacterium]|jgi:DNA-binding NtrC family response regulator
MASPNVSVVFVVDDEEVIAKSLALILNKNGFRALSFLDPLEALEAMKADPPDLLISDVAMPQISGEELAMRVSASYPKCKVLLFSGQAAMADLLHVARKRGHNFPLVSKPIHPDELLDEIRKL